KENRPFEVYLKINGISIDLDKSNDNLRELAISRFDFSFDGTKLQLFGKTRLTKFIGNTESSREDFRNYLQCDEGKKFFDFLRKKSPDINKSKNPFFIEFKKEFDFSQDIGGLEIYDGEKANPGRFNGKIDEFNFDNRASLDENIKDVFGQFSD